MTLNASAEIKQPDGDGGSDILSGYAEQHEFARTNRITPRTVARYRNRPDGIPWVTFGGRVYIPVREAGDWLKNQIRHPNKRRNG